MDDLAERSAPLSVDSRVPLALVATVLIQAGTALVWVGATSARIDELEMAAQQRAGIEARTIRLEEQVRHLGIVLDRIDTKLDRMAPGPQEFPAARRRL